MAKKKSLRTLLLECSDEDLATFAKGAGVGNAWARFAKIPSADLSRGKPASVRKLRPKIMLDSDRYARALVATGFISLVNLQQGSHSEDEAASDDPCAAATDVVARKLGARLTRQLLEMVAASEFPIAAEVSERLDELAARAESATWPDIGRLAAVLGAGLADDAPPADQLRAVDAVLEEAERVGEFLAHALEALETGHPAEPRVGRLIDAWSQMTQDILEKVGSGAPNLHALKNQLEEEVASAAAAEAAAAVKAAARREVLDKVRVLEASGMADLIPTLLEGNGYTSVEELEELATVDTETTSKEAAEPEVVLASEPAADPGSDAEEAAPGPADLVADAPATEVEQAAVEASEATSEAEPTVSAALAKEGAPDPARAADVAPATSQAPPIAPAVTPADPRPTVHADITTLVAQSRDGLAYHLAVATGEPQARLELLRLHCASTSVPSDNLVDALAELAPDDAAIHGLDVDDVRLLLAASLRSSLRLGYAPISPLALIDRAGLQSSEYLPVVEAASGAVLRSQKWESQATGSTGESPAEQWATLADEAEGLLAAFKAGSVSFQRASRVLHHLALPKQAVGGALLQIAENSQGGMSAATVAPWEVVDALWELLRDGGAARLIDDVDARLSTPQQRRKKIEFRARERLLDEIDKVRQLLDRTVSLRRAIATADNGGEFAGIDDLNRALDAFHDGPVDSLGNAALYRFVEWLRNPAPIAGDARLADVLDFELAPLYELPRDETGRVTRVPDATQVAALVAGRSSGEIVRGYIERGNIAQARLLAGSGEVDLGEDVDDALQKGARDAGLKHKAAIARAEQAAARLQSLYIDDAARDITERINRYRYPSVKDRFDLLIDPLGRIAAEAEERLAKESTALTSSAIELDCSESDRKRVLDRLAAGDEVLAVEYIRLLKAGRPLPDVPEVHGDDFREFFPAVVAAASTAASNGGDPVDAVRTHLGAGADLPSDRFLQEGLIAWRDTKKDWLVSGHQVMQRRVADIVRMLGLTPRDQDWLREQSRTRRGGHATFSVRANPVDKSYAPSLGTLAHGSYVVTLIRDVVQPNRIFDLISEQFRNQPNIVFYFGVLGNEERLELRRLTSRKGFSPLVIDEAVVGWLSTRRESAWRFAQRVTLPFTTLNPYTPFAGGEVPDEVFVGRTQERADIENPAGPTFVYGGRQLGKSSLLRRVERMFDKTQDRPVPGSSEPRKVGDAALYIDLKAAGIGDSSGPAAIWPLLAERLKGIGLLSSKVAKNAGREEVTKQLINWLREDESNRLLLLLDEADNFLTRDAEVSAFRT